MSEYIIAHCVDNVSGVRYDERREETERIDYPPRTRKAIDELMVMKDGAGNRTTELREKLDELGIEHFDYDKGGRTQTQWEAPDGKRHFTYETSDNPAKTARLVIAWHPTPDQAIAATLGNSRVKPPCDGGYCPLCGAIERTCHIVKNSRKYVLSDGRELFDDGCSICNGYVGDGDNYCSNCGAKVVDE